MPGIQGPDSAKREKLADLIDRYEKDILRICYVYLHDSEQAKDAVQDTFLKAFTRLDSLRDEAKEKSWLVTIAVNVCRDYLKRGWHKYENRLITPEDLKKLGNAPDEDRELVMDVMNLPVKYRQVILLVYWNGMTIREAAKCIQTSESTVFRRLEKAKKMIA